MYVAVPDMLVGLQRRGGSNVFAELNKGVKGLRFYFDYGSRGLSGRCWIVTIGRERGEGLGGAEGACDKKNGVPACLLCGAKAAVATISSPHRKY